MKIEFKLYASLGQYLPAAVRQDNRLPLEVAEAATIRQVIEPFGLPEKLVHLVLVTESAEVGASLNGVDISPCVDHLFPEDTAIDKKSEHLSGPRCRLVFAIRELLKPFNELLIFPRPGLADCPGPCLIESAALEITEISADV